MASLGGSFDPSNSYNWTGAQNFTGTATEGGATRLYGTTAPISGPAGTGYLVAANGSTYLNVNSKVLYVNETGAASPYWTPLGIDSHPNMLAWYTDFRDMQGKALANTDAVAILAGSGLRIHGSGVEASDSGVVVTAGEAGPIATVTASAANAKIVALSFGATDSSNLPMQPDREGPMVVEATVQMATALTLRRFFLGFLGTCADALVSPVTGATTTITLVQDDLAGLYFDAGLTAATTLFAPHNKSDEAATMTTAAAALDVATVFPAAGTGVRLRVEIAANGTMRCFADRVLVATVANALDVDEEVAPVLLIGSTSTAVKAMVVARFAAWGTRA